MARGLDELIDWLVAETAYCGETGLRVADFVTAVSRFHARPLQKRDPDDDAPHGQVSSHAAGEASDVLLDMPLARKAWEWLTERPEILVGRNGSRRLLSLDDALALPEPLPPASVDDAAGDEERKVDLTAAALQGKGAAASSTATSGQPRQKQKPPPKRKQVSFAAATKQQPRRGARAGADEAAAAAAAEDPNVRPRLYATEQTIWHTLTGHGVDYKKLPLLEWKCLQGIASARKQGILQADLRVLVGQDKRSVPKRTDFLAAKGYAVKRTTIARGYRTSMLWLTEFAPVELPDADESAAPVVEASRETAAATAARGSDKDATDPAVWSARDLTGSGIDLSPEFLSKGLEPVPWRNRWIGDAIEFSSFGQTVLAIVRAWSVIRVVDLKLKLGIMGMRWQMRTLARVCREFVASGILRFVAAMRQDERKLFRDCIKFERDPTPAEWAVYLAAGRRRTPMAELRAKRKKEQEQWQGQGRGASVGGGGDDANTLDLAALDALDEEDDEYGEGTGMGGGGLLAPSTPATPAWALDVPLTNLIYDTVDRAGIDGITSPEICRATLGPSFQRYIFSLITAMARPGSQPDHLKQFQLHCEATRAGRNNSYLFRTLANAKLAERLCRGESTEDIERQTAAELAEKTADAKTFWDLQGQNKLLDQPADAVLRLYGLDPLPPQPTAEELEQEARLAAERARPPKHKRPGRPKKAPLQEAPETHEVQDTQESMMNGAPASGTPSQNNYMGVAKAQMERSPTPAKRKRGRPPKAKIVEEEAAAESEQMEKEPASAEEGTAGDIELETEVAGPLPMVRLGEPNSLSRKPRSLGRPKRSIVLIFRHDKLRDSGFLTNQLGYKEGAIRLEPGEDEEGQDEPDEQDEPDGQNEQDKQDEPIQEVGPAALFVPVASLYQGNPGHLTFDHEHQALLFTYAAGPRRGRGRPSPREPISIAMANLASDPVIRTAPGGDGPALVLEARENSCDGHAAKDKEDDGPEPHDAADSADVRETSWPFVFPLDDETLDNHEHAVNLCNALVALRPRAEQQDDDHVPTPPPPPPARRRGRQPGQKSKRPGKPAKAKADRAGGEGPKEFVCETCSGVWKNLLGLQYHQTKSRTACNPNYAVPPPEEKLEKRRGQREVDRADIGTADETAAETSLAQGRGRRELRRRKPAPGALREDSPVSGASSRSHSPASVFSADGDSFEASSPRHGRDGRTNRTTGYRRTMDYTLQIKQHKNGDTESAGDLPPGIRGIRGAAQASLHAYPSSLEDSDDEDLPPAGGLGPAQASDVDMAIPPEPNRQTQDSPAQPSHLGKAWNETPARPALPEASPEVPSEPVPCYPTLGIDAHPTPSAGTPFQGQGPAGFRMPALPKNAEKLTPFAMRSYIMMEITKYLVDYFDGVFPGDRSLWYAAFRVYTRSFPGEDPPTLTVTKAAVKKLEMARELEEHTFGFRDPRGQFIYCRLLARPGADLFQSDRAQKFKKQVQAAYPQPFVPNEFVPSDKDMAVLRILDKDMDRAASRNTRGRRPLAPEIEVLNAPFYEQPQAATRSAAHAVLVVGPGDDEDSDRGAGAGAGRNRASGLKRKGLESADGTPKRRRTRFADAIAGQDASMPRLGAGGDVDADAGAASDVDANIDPALRTIKAVKAPAKAVAKSGNPGLDSLPADFFAPGTGRQQSKARPLQHRADEGFTTFVHFLPPNTHLEDDQDEDGTPFVAGQERSVPMPPPRGYKFVSKTHRLGDLGPQSPRAWPVIPETAFERQSDASFSMDGFMPSRKALLRQNLPQTPGACAAMLRGNQKMHVPDDTPGGTFYRDLESVRSWELSQAGADLLRNPSVAPTYVFLHVSFPGAQRTAEDAAGRAAGSTPLRWTPKNQYTVESIPYGTLDAGDSQDGDGAGGMDGLAAPGMTPRKKMTRASDVAAREKQAQQAKYVLSSRREMTAYPQKPEDYIGADESSEDAVDWAANDTLLAAFVVLKTLLGGVNQAIDWGLMMRLFPGKRLSALRAFWASVRRERQPHIDKLTERFQQAFLAAYASSALPPLDYDNVLAYDWGRVVGFAVQLMRHDTNALPATRAALDASHMLVDVAPSRVGGWREDFFHVSRSVWNRLQDSASEAAAVAVDASPPLLPAEAAAQGAVDLLRTKVARSWIRALCGTPHKRYPPSRIKQKLLTLGSIGVVEGGHDQDQGLGPSQPGKLGEGDTNRLLQTVIGDLTADRILRRTKSLAALGGRMYMPTEAYDSTLDKAAMEDKFRQAWAFKHKLDAAFRGVGDDDDDDAQDNKSFAIPLDTNDDGMVMALMNLQAHGRVRVEAVDAPHIPFGFEPGRYESRKFPKHYQRFRQRIVPTDRYAFSDGAPLAGLLGRMRRALGGGGEDGEDGEDGVLPPPQKGAHEEMPIWRDFFGVLDRIRLARLTSAVVFSLATRGATPVKQTAAHLRPIVEPFEVQMLMDWATGMGLLDEHDDVPGSRAVAEWWWLLVGQMYAAADEADAVKTGGQTRDAEAEAEAEAEAVEEEDIGED